MSWWLTSVESVANEQANDRQSPISTDSSQDHKKSVAKEIADRRARKELRLAEDGGILVARAIIADIFDNGPFKVLIPQAKEAEWLKYADFRGQEQFWDLVDALAILRWRQRTRDSDGWLVAAEEDLIEAKDILTAHKVANFSDLTPSEVELVGAMTGGHTKTQRELTEALGIAQSTLSERLKSIMAKSPLVTEDWENGKKVYALNPNMDLGEAYWSGLDLINVKIASEEAYRRRHDVLLGCYRYVIGIPIVYTINNSNRIPNSLSVNL
jgi:predicted DNA binding protein